MAHRLTWRRFCSYTLIFGGFCFFIYSWVLPCDTANKSKMVPKDPIQYTYDAENHAFPYDKEMPLIFIGGVPRSGTTLMRAMLDAHPEVRCGEETRVIPRLLGMRTSWFKSEREAKRLREAGVNEEIVDSALGAFILEIIAKHGEPAQRLCNKDPFTLKSSIYLSQIFPNSKFVLMIRDGRAVVHSIISRHVTISGFDLKNFRQCLEKWNQAMETMYYQCLRVGAARCMPVYYEQLVLHPQTLSRKILEFLEIPWHDSVLHHDQFINKPGGVSLSKIERSTDQVIKPINLEALGKWASAVPEDVKKDIHQVAPMLGKLGYDPYAYPPNYGEADDIVHDNTLHIRRNEEEWRRKALEVKSYSKPNRPKHVGTPPRVEETVNHADNRTVNPPANPPGPRPGGGTVVNPGVPSPQGDNGGAPR